MHPDLAIQIARQHAADLTDELAAVAGRRQARRARRPARPGMRAALGKRLVRWGHRLAPATPFAGAPSTGRRPATMGP